MQDDEKIITIGDLARLANVSETAARRHARVHCKTQTINRKLCVSLEDPKVIGYINAKKHQRRFDPSTLKQLPGTVNVKEVLDPANEIDIDELQNSGVAIAQLKDIVSLRAKEAVLRLKMLQIEEQRGNLISRDLVENALFNYLDILNKRLFVLVDQTVDRITALVEQKGAEFARGEIIDLLSKEIGRAIKSTRADVGRGLEE